MFGKLREHEIELRRLEKHEVQENKPKSIDLRVELREQMEEENLDEDENINILVKMFGKSLQNDKHLKFGKGRIFFKKKDASTSNQIFTCFEGGQQGNMKKIAQLLQKKVATKERKSSNQRRPTLHVMIMK